MSSDAALSSLRPRIKSGLELFMMDSISRASLRQVGLSLGWAGIAAPTALGWRGTHRTVGEETVGATAS